MNCERCQREILLDESGELSARRAMRLGRHLASCADCRGFREGARVLSRAAARALPEGEAGARVLAQIRDEARAELLRSAPALVLHAPAIRTLAWAASFALLLGGGVLTLLPMSEGDRPGRIRSINALVAMVSDESALDAQAREGGAEDDLHVLARRLLRAQGMADEEASVPDEPVTAPEEPLPTETRSGSTPEPLARGYV